MIDQNSIEKYRDLAQKAIKVGDYVLAESFYQQAEHYIRSNNEAKRKLPVPQKTKKHYMQRRSYAPKSSDFETSLEELFTSQSKL